LLSWCPLSSIVYCEGRGQGFAITAMESRNPPQSYQNKLQHEELPHGSNHKSY